MSASSSYDVERSTASRPTIWPATLRSPSRVPAGDAGHRWSSGDETSAGGALDTHCLYFFEVAKAEDAWHISAITQKVLWNDGDPTLHAGLQEA